MLLIFVSSQSTLNRIFISKDHKQNFRAKFQILIFFFINCIDTCTLVSMPDNKSHLIVVCKKNIDNVMTYLSIEGQLSDTLM